jgi:hypothetical protein
MFTECGKDDKHSLQRETLKAGSLLLTSARQTDVTAGSWDVDSVTSTFKGRLKLREPTAQRLLGYKGSWNGWR